MSPTILLPCLQVSPVDVDAAVELSTLIAFIGNGEGRPFWICHRRDVDPHKIVQISQGIAEAGYAPFAFPGRNYAEGWPDGCNALWSSAMIESLHRLREGWSNHEAILTFEADCVPLREDWIQVLENEWLKNRPAAVVGNKHDSSHINGNAMFSGTLLKEYPQLLGNSFFGSWDWANRELFLKIGKDTNTIYQLYQQATISEDDFIRITKNGARPALLHGIKDGTARKLAYKHIFRSSGAAVPQYMAGGDLRQGLRDVTSLNK